MRRWCVIAVCAAAIAALAVLSACSASGASSEAGLSGGSAGSVGASASSAGGSSSAASSSAVLPESEWGNLFETMGEDYVAFGRVVQTELPGRAYMVYQGEGGGEPTWFDDAGTITALFNALAASGASEDVSEVRTDDYTGFGFEFADGSTAAFLFDSMTFMVEEGGQWKVYAVVATPELEQFATQARAATLGS